MTARRVMMAALVAVSACGRPPLSRPPTVVTVPVAAPDVEARADVDRAPLSAPGTSRRGCEAKTRMCRWSLTSNTLDVMPMLVDFVSDRSGFVYGDGCLFSTADAGRTWAKRWCSRTPHGVWQMMFNESEGGVLVGEDVVATHDGGKTWYDLKLPRITVNAAAVTSDGSVYVVGRRSSAGKDAGVFLRGTLDGGVWKEEIVDAAATDLLSVAATSSGHVLVAGDPAVLVQSEDAGRHWAAVDVPGKVPDESYEELALESCGVRWIRTSAESLLVSKDAGAPWVRRAWATSITPSSGSIAMVDPQRIWVADHDVLFSYDGGQMWSRFSDGALGPGDEAQRYDSVQYVETSHLIVAFGSPKIAWCRF